MLFVFIHVIEQFSIFLHVKPTTHFLVVMVQNQTLKFLCTQLSPTFLADQTNLTHSAMYLWNLCPAQPPGMQITACCCTELVAQPCLAVLAMEHRKGLKGAGEPRGVPGRKACWGTQGKWSYALQSIAAMCSRTGQKQPLWSHTPQRKCLKDVRKHFPVEGKSCLARHICPPTTPNIAAVSHWLVWLKGSFCFWDRNTQSSLKYWLFLFFSSADNSKESECHILLPTLLLIFFVTPGKWFSVSQLPHLWHNGNNDCK